MRGPIIGDRDVDVVFVADTPERRFPEVHRRLVVILHEYGVEVRVIPGTVDVWCRDQLPVPVGEGRFVQFRYEPDYLDGEYRYLRADGVIGPTLPWFEKCARSEVVPDGGNVVSNGDRAIVRDKIFLENPGMSRQRLIDRLVLELGLSKIIVVPREPHDPIGYPDEMVAWLDGRTALVND